MFRASLFFGAILAGLALPSNAAELAIAVTGPNPASGQLLISVFDRSET